MRLGLLLVALVVLSGCLVPSAAEREESPRARWMDARVFDANGDLLVSTWPNETGSLGSVDMARIWAPFERTLARAPADQTLRIEGHLVPPLRQERMELARHVDVPRYEVLSRSSFVPAGFEPQNGTRIDYAGAIPLEVVTADNESVVVRHAPADGQRIPLPCSTGLQLVAAGVGDGMVRYRLEAPDGSFTAHLNCRALRQLLESGYYVVREVQEDDLVVDRYASLAEAALEGRRVDIEVVFRDVEMGSPTLSERLEVKRG